MKTFVVLWLALVASVPSPAADQPRFSLINTFVDGIDDPVLAKRYLESFSGILKATGLEGFDELILVRILQKAIPLAQETERPGHDAAVEFLARVDEQLINLLKSQEFSKVDLAAQIILQTQFGSLNVEWELAQRILLNLSAIGPMINKPLYLKALNHFGREHPASEVALIFALGDRSPEDVQKTAFNFLKSKTKLSMNGLLALIWINKISVALESTQSSSEVANPRSRNYPQRLLRHFKKIYPQQIADLENPRRPAPGGPEGACEAHILGHGAD